MGRAHFDLMAYETPRPALPTRPTARAYMDMVVRSPPPLAEPGPIPGGWKRNQPGCCPSCGQLLFECTWGCSINYIPPPSLFVDMGASVFNNPATDPHNCNLCCDLADGEHELVFSDPPFGSNSCAWFSGCVTPCEFQASNGSEIISCCGETGACCGGTAGCKSGFFIAVRILDVNHFVGGPFDPGLPSDPRMRANVTLGRGCNRVSFDGYNGFPRAITRVAGEHTCYYCQCRDAGGGSLDTTHETNCSRCYNKMSATANYISMPGINPCVSTSNVVTLHKVDPTIGEYQVAGVCTQAGPINLSPETGFECVGTWPTTISISV